MKALLGGLVALVVASGCGGAQPNSDGNGLSRYGVHAVPPTGWDARLGRGSLHAANFELPPVRLGWMAAAARGLAADEVLLLLFERDHGPGDSPPEPPAPGLVGPLRLAHHDFDPNDGVTDDSGTSGHGYARRLFSVSGRDFVLFVEAGVRSPSAGLLEETNDLLSSLRVEPGDFYKQTVTPARFSERAGWHVGSTEPRDARADGDWLTSWASTIPYEDAWNALPPSGTLELLPSDGVVIWVALERNNRFPPEGGGDPSFPPRKPPLRLRDFERNAGWEGQIRDVPEYRLWGTVRGEYHVDVRVFFGRAEPTAGMLAEAQAMLDGLQLPEWGPWELDRPATSRR